MTTTTGRLVPGRPPETPQDTRRGNGRNRSAHAIRVGVLLFAAALATLFTGAQAMAYEKRAYTVVEHEGDFEIRSYPPAIVAETTVDGDFEAVGGSAFRILAAYISGANQTDESISMTAPVTQEASDSGYRITFTMPSEFDLETLPAPSDERVALRTEAETRYAAVRYRGFWSRDNYTQHLETLRAWIDQRGLEATGEAVWARYDPPFMPWFLRRNEILIPVAD